ncbi:MAG: sugar phosphate isomerase/epimerase [Chloroflexi bacterium]|jgi:sugar phosphate isomerase/epimerase|nr:sugar phosphate isomerase/epimerase [Chloroflexota bacterium]MBT4074505.1 sugar phosphate isomerase/epimerase [Chloroflexota bacterium]MBT4515944.1 sugar phosphate isomerase/epimerase [Chloroflexota bacterium]MBT5319658.1 sugar phosphate isomerase/epimerase [Chloroflexota bacterium]MBT6682143.1 sugar phosphate isomerase/epimerase [Chloroflexota bacterium]
MLLGVAGLTPGDWTTVTENVTRVVMGHGFRTLQLRVSDPHHPDPATVTRVQDAFKSAGLTIGQTVGEYGGGLVSDDDSVRRNAIEALKQMTAFTRVIGGSNTYLRPGSMNPNGAWYPHPDNRSDAVFERLVDSAREASQAASNEGVMLAVEGGVVCPLFSASRTREFFDAVDSPSMGYNMDPVNYIANIETAYDSTFLLEDLFDQLGHVTIAAHAKDFGVVDGLLPHFEEVVIGQGLLDQETFLTRMRYARPDAHVLIEHLPDELIPAAREGLNAAAARAGIEWDDPPE